MHHHLTDWIQNRTRLIEDELRRRSEDLSNRFDTLKRAMIYSFQGRGKKFRPLLMLASGEDLGLSPSSLAPYFSAVEWIHCYSLVHDDLPAMDNDDFRRGKPTTHRVFGEAMALLAGDALLTWAFEAVCGEEADFPAENRIRAARLLADCAGWNGMVGGQSLDLEAENRPPDPNLLDVIHRNKTGRLIEAALCIPPALNGSPGEIQKGMRRFSNLFGTFYQIQDDILDVTGDEKTAGKKLNKDGERNKLTYVSAFGLESSLKMAEDLKTEAREVLSEMPASTELLESLLNLIAERKH